MRYLLLIIFISLTLISCTQSEEPIMEKNYDQYEDAIFAGGCFWCSESDFEKHEGIIEVISGYTGGQEQDPTYQEVSSGTTGHYEAIKVIYDPKKINYAQLVDIFWKHIDPTDAGGSFVDRGPQYRSAIFYSNNEEKQIIEDSKAQIEASGKFDKPVVTAILPKTTFYPAEDYHQDYYKKNPIRYKFYRQNSGRDQFIEQYWSDGTMTTSKIETPYARPSDEEIKAMLTDLQFKVTQKDGTEPAFQNEYHDNKEEGIYVDIVSGEPLFSSTDKYDSGTGWPSFSKPINDTYVITKTDYKLILPRTEVRSKYADSHLGHVFNDGPAPTGKRYCMNSASLRFIPKDKLEEEGYGQYLSLFE